MIKILKFTLPIVIPAGLVALCFIPNNADTQNKLLNTVTAIGTMGALLFLILDKKERETDEKQQFWHDHLPYLTVSSPCDPTQNRCDIDILSNLEEFNNRGARYFSIANFSKSNAHDIKIDYCTNAEFCKAPLRSHFIDFLPTYSEPVYEKSDPVGIKYLYSRYHINPDTKKVLLDEFDLCNFVQNCDIDKGLKTIYIRLVYHSSPTTAIVKQITSIFKADLECEQVAGGNRTIKINNIVQINYSTKI